MNLRPLAFAAAIAASSLLAQADEIIFKNGDKLTGRIETLDGDKLKITSTVAGDVVVEMKDVATFSTDVPLAIQTNDGRKINEAVSASEQPDQVTSAGGEVIPFSSIKRLNPPPEKWTGSIMVNGSIARGNTNTDDLGVSIALGLRRNNETINDRITLGGAYNLGRQEEPDTGDKVTTTDNWHALGQYDRFWTDKLYGYVNGKVEHDRIADLHYRLSPGVGLGYQWIEDSFTKFTTEAGVTYVYEDYISGGDEEHVALRLAYRFDRKINDMLSVFHNLEWLPAFDDPGDYNLLADAGVRAKFTKNFFSEFKLEWKRDSTPAPGSDKNDLRYILGVGWLF